MSAAHLEPAGDGHFRLAGVLSFATVPGLWQQTRGLFAGQAAVKIDLRGVERSDSAGLALLVEWMREAERHKTRLQFVNMPSQMLAIARVSGLDHILPLSREE